MATNGVVYSRGLLKVLSRNMSCGKVYGEEKYQRMKLDTVELLWTMNSMLAVLASLFTKTIVLCAFLFQILNRCYHNETKFRFYWMPLKANNAIANSEQRATQTQKCLRANHVVQSLRELHISFSSYIHSLCFLDPSVTLYDPARAKLNFRQALTLSNLLVYSAFYWGFALMYRPNSLTVASSDIDAVLRRRFKNIISSLKL